MNLLLIDDHPLFGVGFAHAVAHARPDVGVQTAASIEQGLALAALTPAIDIALIDYRLGRDDGLAGMRRFGAQHPLVARVLISGDEDAALATRARAAGASAFLGKSLAISQMLAVLQTVCAGGEHFGAHSNARAAAGSSGPTARQLEVLTLIGRGRQNKQIADELGIAERTVKLHITALFDTLNARNRTHLLVRARELGLP
jgi:DNA-binding NarL/FixJ family response regulator